ncbi:prolyl oligopeptidase family serine peptidase [candidate division KSB1 bacterium]|nr:prolyl oligopeptidase family serine peptidase [candidate division KSB1 bacterium]
MKYILTIIGVLVLGWLLLGYLTVEFVSRPTHQSVPIPPSLQMYPVESVTLHTPDQSKIAGWYVTPNTSNVKGSVILLTCLRGNRLNLVARARFYLERGFSTLLIDLRSTGESEGQMTSFGWYEKQELLAALQYLRREKQIGVIGLHGISAGAATISFAAPQLDQIAFIVLESCYDSMSHAFQHRVETRGGVLAPCFVPVKWFAQLKFHGDFENMNPVDYVHFFKCPVLVMAGTADYRVPTSDTQALFDRIKSRKQLWWFQGLGHVDFYAQRPVEFEIQLINFLRSGAFL